jgi:hypothetical protein
MGNALACHVVRSLRALASRLLTYIQHSERLVVATLTIAIASKPVLSSRI